MSAAGMGSEYIRPVADHSYGGNVQQNSFQGRQRTKPTMQTSTRAMGGAPHHEGGQHSSITRVASGTD